MNTKIQDTFLQLVRLGIGNDPVSGFKFQVSSSLSAVDWQAVEDVANEQGLLGVMLDGVDKLPRELRPEKKAIIQSIGQLVQTEQMYAVQEHAAAEMALLLHQHGIRTYVLKGAVVAECYPRPEHRRSVDMDCFLVNDNDNLNLNDNDTEQLDVWEKGNRVVEEAGFEVARGFYKNSTFHLPGLAVENHRFMTPFRGSKRLKSLERLLQSMIINDKLNENDNHNGNGGGKELGLGSALKLNRRFEGTWMYRPPVMVSALFLIEHAYSHFLHEGLTWRHVLDWQMFRRRHQEEIDWRSFDAFVDEFGFGKFYESYCRLGRFLIGDVAADGLSSVDLRMLSDVWAPLDLHESLHGVKAKFQLAGNYWRARWKYKLFTDMTWLRALLEWVLGAVFDRQPRLG